MALLLIATAVTGIVWMRRRRNRARIEAMSPAEREAHDEAIAHAERLKTAAKGLTAAEKEHASHVKSAEKELAHGRSAYDKAVRRARREVAAAEQIGSRKIGSYAAKDGKVSATEFAITVPQGTFRLDPSVTATVDTAGNFATSSRTTATRVAAGAVLFGPVGAIVGASAKKRKMHDMRELYLFIQGAEFATMLTCDPDDGANVRKFATAVNHAAQHRDTLLEQRTTAIAAAKEHLDMQIAATEVVEELVQQLERTQSDASGIEAARIVLALESEPAMELIQVPST
ncbi:hypothetical protein [Microbacterium sp. P5_E9]